ncbi:MAG: YfhO family protein [Anaerolineales bacterium]|nr:YfhO family protein [Anaerolineales bacterium]MCB8940169.1 YfhO family protein [Ardenticatenaceae bacterium]
MQVGIKRLKLHQYDLLAGLFLAGLLMLLYGQTVFTPGELLYGKDVSYFYPNEIVLQDAGFGSEFPLWNPYFGGGAPGLGKIQVGMFYPPVVLLRALFDVETTLDLDAVLHLFLAGMGVYLLMRQFKVARIPALFTAVAFMLSGSFTPRIIAGHASVLRTIAWSGWLLWAYLRLLDRPNWLNAVLTALIIACVILGGHPQMSLMVLLLPLVYFVASFAPKQIRTGNWRKLGAGFGWSVLAVGLALSLTAVQILPYLAWVQQTVRAEGNAFADFALMVRHSILWHQLLALTMPTIWYEPARLVSLGSERPPFFWEISAFTGVITLLILGLGLALRSFPHRLQGRFFGGLAAAGLLLSLGTINPLYELLFQSLPYIRAPGRFMFWWTLATAVSAGLVLDVWLKNQAIWPRLNKLALGLLVAAALLVVGGLVLQPRLPAMLPHFVGFTTNSARIAQQTVGLNLNQFAVKLLILAGLFAAMGCWREYGRSFGVLLLLFLALEMGWFARSITQPTPLTNLYNPESPYAQMEYAAAKYRFQGYRQPPLYLIPTLNHVQNGEESSQFVNLLQTDNGLNLLAANFVIIQDELTDGELMQTRNGWNLYSLWQNLPRIYAAPSVRFVLDKTAALQIVGNAAFSGWQEAVVVGDGRQVAELAPLAAADDDEPAVFTGRYLEYGNNHLVAEVTTDRPVMVVFSEMYDADWQAQVNGRATTIWQVNYAFRGVVVESGRSMITMQYRPRAYRLGAIISGTAGLLILCVAVYQMAFRRRSGEHL